MATPRLAKVRLGAADGGPLRVDVRTGARPGEARPAVVICHGFKGFKDWGFFPKLSERLAVAGFTALSFNFFHALCSRRPDSRVNRGRLIASLAVTNGSSGGGGKLANRPIQYSQDARYTGVSRSDISAIIKSLNLKSNGGSSISRF